LKRLKLHVRHGWSHKDTKTEMSGNEAVKEEKQAIAAMDLGSNSNRLLIADLNGVPLFRDVRHVALGEKLAEQGYFTERSMERAICSFMDFQEMMKVYNVKRYRAIATAACRMSKNTEAFVAEVKKMSGVELEVISEFEEARLTLLGARLNAPKDKKYLFVYDLGGGSTEITLATNEDNPKILATVSVPLGARNATEMFSLQEYKADKAKVLEDKVRAYAAEFMEQIKAYDYQGNTALIATSSTPLRLTSWINKMPQYDKFAADGLTVEVKDLDELIGKVLHYSFKKRAASVYVGPNRAGIFIAALVIFRTIYKMLNCDKLTASLKGAQEAIIAELL